MPTRGSHVPGRDRKTRQQGDSILHRHNRRPFQVAVQQPQEHFPQSQTQKQHLPQQVHLGLKR